MTNKPLNDTIHRVTQRVIANSRDSRNAIRRSASVEPSPRFHRSNRSATANRSSG